jgi:hypothetical protein
MLKFKIILRKIIIHFILTIFLVSFFFIINNFIANEININYSSDNVSLYRYKNYKIHCTEKIDFQNCIEGLVNRNSKIKIIYIGNSQLHTINNFKNNQILISEILFKNYINDNIDIITLSLPNINFQETLWILENELKNVNFSYLILPLVLDDFREQGVRKELSDEKIKDKLKSGSTIEHGDQKIKDKLQQIKDKLQHGKNNFIFNLYNLRNFLFGINSSTTRSIIKHSYYLNLKSYENIHNLMKKKNIIVFSYFAPVRQEPIKIYNASEYKIFKEKIINLNIQFNQKIFDLDNVIKSKNFGLINKKNLDYMHFDYQGHLVLFNEIKNIINNKISIKNDF